MHTFIIVHETDDGFQVMVTSEIIYLKVLISCLLFMMHMRALLSLFQEYAQNLTKQFYVGIRFWFRNICTCALTVEICLLY